MDISNIREYTFKIYRRFLYSDDYAVMHHAVTRCMAHAAWDHIVRWAPADEHGLARSGIRYDW